MRYSAEEAVKFYEFLVSHSLIDIIGQDTMDKVIKLTEKNEPEGLHGFGTYLVFLYGNVILFIHRKVDQIYE